MKPNKTTFAYSHTLMGFQDRLDYYIADGWSPQGGLATATDENGDPVYMQLFVKYPREQHFNTGPK